MLGCSDLVQGLIGGALWAIVEEVAGFVAVVVELFELESCVFLPHFDWSMPLCELTELGRCDYDSYVDRRFFLRLS